MDGKINWNGKMWAKIPEYEEYYASSDGSILSTKKREWHIMKPISAKDKHLYVFLYRNGNMRKMWVHRAVLLAWDREPLPGEECRHLNDIPTDNRLKNLCWGTRIENVADKRRNGGIPYGERAGTHKLTDIQVLEIREKYSKDKSSSDLSVEYGVSKNTILQIVKGNKWRHLPISDTTTRHKSIRKTPLSKDEIERGTKALNRYACSVRKERKMIYCACGCGKMLETPDGKGRDRKYIHGHNQIGKTWRWKKNVQNKNINF